MNGKSRRHPLAALPVILALTFAAYSPVWNNGYVWDDDAIFHNFLLRDAAGLVTLWTDPAANFREEHYWPVTYTTFWLEYQLFGDWPRATHVISLAIHVINGLLLFLILKRAGTRVAAAATLVFLIHPIHVESVAWAVERKDVLSAFFCLAALHLWISGLTARPRGAWLRLLPIAALFTLAMLSKSIAATFPAAMAVTAWMLHPAGDPRPLRRHAPAVLAMLALSAALVAVDLRVVSEKSSWSSGLYAADRILIAARALWFYAGEILWPMNLMTIHPRWPIPGAGPTAWIFPAAVGLAAGLLMIGARRGGLRDAAGFSALFAVTLLPVLGFIDFGYMKISFVAERFQYLAGIALVIPVVAAAVRAEEILRAHSVPTPADEPTNAAPGARRIAALALVAALGLTTFDYCRDYRSDLPLFERNTRLAPDTSLAFYNYAIALRKAERGPDEVMARLLRAVELDPKNADAHNLLGVYYKEAGDNESALRHYRRATESGGRYHEAHYNIGLLLREAGDIEGAIAEYRRAIDLDPEFAMAWSNLGAALFESGREQEGIECIRRAARLVPQLWDAWGNLGTIELKRGRYEEAIGYFDESLRRNPEYAEGMFGRGQALEALGRTQMAVAHYERAFMMNPGLYQAAARLGDHYARQGESRNALGWFIQAIRADPENPDLHCRVAEVRLDGGQTPEARKVLEGLLTWAPNHAPGRVLLARTELAEGNPAAAAEQLSLALALTPDHAGAHLLLGGILLDEGNHSEAVAHLRRAVDLEPRNSEAADRLRRALLRTGN